MTSRIPAQKILFVCTGNICRSPMAEAVCRHMASLNDIGVQIDSAGTQGYHIGERPDHRTLKLCAEKGIPTENIRARKLEKLDFSEFDLILGMDSGHVEHMKALAPEEDKGKIRLFMEAAGLGAADVPDPYYGEMEDFYIVYQMVERGCREILDNLQEL